MNARALGGAVIMLLGFAAPMGCAHAAPDMSERPTTAADARPFTRDNQPVAGEVGVVASTQGVAPDETNDRKKQLKGADQGTQPATSPIPPAATSDTGAP